jgi:hypothetical protein
MNQPSGIVFAMAQAGLRCHLATVQIDLVKLAGAVIAAEQLLLAGVMQMLQGMPHGVYGTRLK